MIFDTTNWKLVKKYFNEGKDSLKELYQAIYDRKRGKSKLNRNRHGNRENFCEYEQNEDIFVRNKEVLRNKANQRYIKENVKRKSEKNNS